MKRKLHSHLPFATLTDRGLVRDQNEDSLAITAFASVSELIPESLLCVLCDGVGGHQGGEIASRIAVDQITTYIEDADASSPSIQLINAIQTASEQVKNTAQTSVELYGMASTAACAWIIGKRLFIANAGDTRIYLVRQGCIHQISTDHTWIQEALNAGMIKTPELKDHPKAHAIKRFLGSETPPDVDTRLRFSEDPNQNRQGMLLEAGERLFMCSDGITDQVRDNEILALLSEHNLDDALEKIKSLVYQRGATDNLSMILVKIPSGNPPITQRQKTLRLFIFAMILMIASFIGVYLGWLLIN